LKKKKERNETKKKKQRRVNPHGYFGTDTGFGSATRTAFNCSIGFAGTPGAAADYPRQGPASTKHSTQRNWEDSPAGRAVSLGLSRDMMVGAGMYSQELKISDPGAYNGHREALRPQTESRLRTGPSHAFTRGPRMELKAPEGAGPASYNVDTTITEKNTPHASFSGHRERRAGEIKRPSKRGNLTLRKDFIYREVALNKNFVNAAPGAHVLPPSCGEQIESQRRFDKGMAFGTSGRLGPETMGRTHESLKFGYLCTDICGPGYDAPRPTTGNVKTSSFKRQSLSHRRNAPSAGFGTGSRFAKPHSYKWHTKLSMSW